MKRLHYILLPFVLLLSFGCNKKEVFGPDPYAGGKEPLGIVFRDLSPSPSQGRPGEEMTFMVDGALAYKDKLSFFINDSQAEIVSLTDSSITAILPENVSSGGVHLVVDAQVYPGPMCKILGKVNIDPIFRSGRGSNGTIYSILALESGQLMIVGTFSDYNGQSSIQKIHGLANLTSSGEFVPNISYGEAVGELGSLTTIIPVSEGKYLLGGYFREYNTNKNVLSMTRINPTASLDMTTVELLNLTSDPENSFAEVPAFNGGVSGGVDRIFYHDNKITAIGNFSMYQRFFYENSTINSMFVDYFEMNQIVRMDINGALDSTYFVDHNVRPKKSLPGANGFIYDGLQQSDGRLVVTGVFTHFNDQKAGSIVRLDNEGKVDPDFFTQTGVTQISHIRQGLDSRLWVIGSFQRYGGFDTDQIALLNADGSVNTSFRAAKFEGGKPNFVYQLSNGLVLVSGTFDKYNGVIRKGLMILNPDGSLAEDYNNTGAFLGQIHDVHEGRNSLGQHTLILVGSFSRFNGQSDLGNIVRLVIQD